MDAFLVWTLNEARNGNWKKKNKIGLFFILDQSNNYLYWTNLESLLF